MQICSRIVDRPKLGIFKGTMSYNFTYSTSGNLSQFCNMCKRQQNDRTKNVVFIHSEINLVLRITLRKCMVWHIS